jgi:hypothetical protein
VLPNDGDELHDTPAVEATGFAATAVAAELMGGLPPQRNDAARFALYQGSIREEERCHCRILRCVFGNPFRPLAINASLLSETVVRLAATIYEQRAFERMAVLADALEECGVTNEALLAHCRADTPHARGCHVLDLILGKG